MPRTARASVGGMWYHALNRGNRREAVFHKPGDYDAFVEAMIDARARVPLDLLGYCLMPNHFHLVLRPHVDGDLGRWMQWLLTAHARRYHRHYGTTGHVWQGRFKAFPVEDDDHLVTVLRYVERNALRAELVSRAEDWKWSSLPGWKRGDPLLWRARSRSAMRGGWSGSTSRSPWATSSGCGTRCPAVDPTEVSHGLGRRRFGWGWNRACVRKGGPGRNSVKARCPRFFQPNARGFPPEGSGVRGRTATEADLA